MSNPQLPAWQQASPEQAPSGLPIGGVLPPLPPPNPYHQELPPASAPQPAAAPLPPHGYPQDAAPQIGDYPPAAFQQQGFQQQGFQQQGFQQSGFQQPGFQEGPALHQHAYPQGPASQAAYPQAGYPQNPALQAGYPQHGYPQGQAPQAGGYPPAGFQEPGFARQPAAPAGYTPAAFPQYERWAPPEPKAVRPAGALVTAAAGLVAIVGAFLTWATISAPDGDTFSMTGAQTHPGRAAAAIGLLIAIFGFVRFAGRPDKRRQLALLGTVKSLGLTGLAVWQILDVLAVKEHLRAKLPADTASELLTGLQVTVGPGLWLLAAAGVVGLVSSLAGLRGAQA